jgi:Ni/Co efflux regulator RcnB
MKKLLISMAAISALTIAAPVAAKPGKGQSGNHAGKHQGKQSDQLDRLGYDGRFAVRQSGRFCPPGLAKKNNGCLPPGQAKKLGIGDRLPGYLSGYNIPDRYRDRYYDNRDYSYRYEDDSIYRVNRGSGMIDQIISVLGL